MIIDPKGLLPCPFCGGGAFVAQSAPRGGPFWVVCAGKCVLEGPAKDTEAEAISVWNTRSTPPVAAPGAVAWRWRYDDPANAARKLGWIYGPVEPPSNAIGRSWSGWECEPLHASPMPPIPVRVSEEMVEAFRVAAKMKPVRSSDDPKWQAAIDSGTQRIRDGLAAALSLPAGGTAGMQDPV